MAKKKVPTALEAIRSTYKQYVVTVEKFGNYKKGDKITCAPSTGAALVKTGLVKAV